MATKIIQAKYDNNPNYIMDMIINNIIDSGNSYPNNGSVTNDHLRDQLQKVYDINLSMFDTHSFRLGDYTGAFYKDVYFVYEAPISLINNLVGDYTNYSIPLTVFPDGIFIGFFPTEFKDANYRKTHMIEYAKVIYGLYYNLYCSIRGDYKYNSFYFTIFKLNLIAQVIDSGTKINWVNYSFIPSDDPEEKEEPLFNIYKYFTDKEDLGDYHVSYLETFGYLMTKDEAYEHTKEIQTAYKSYNYADVCQLFRKYGTSVAKLENYGKFCSINISRNSFYMMALKKKREQMELTNEHSEV